MATKNNGITRADALLVAIQLLTAAYAQEYRPEGFEDTDYPAVADVLNRMYGTVTKPRAKVVSKARKVNENLAAKVHAEIVKRGDGVTTTEVVGFGLPEIQTTQKASAVCRVGVELGLLRKCVNGKVITYAIA